MVQDITQDLANRIAARYGISLADVQRTGRAMINLDVDIMAMVTRGRPKYYLNSGSEEHIELVTKVAMETHVAFSGGKPRKAVTSVTGRKISREFAEPKAPVLRGVLR